MRFRLRTLLIVLTVGCVFLAWVAYLRQTAAYHRREAERIAYEISESAWSHPDMIRESVVLYAEQRMVPNESQVWQPNWGRGLVLDDRERTEWDRAVRHQRMATV